MIFDGDFINFWVLSRLLSCGLFTLGSHLVYLDKTFLVLYCLSLISSSLVLSHLGLVSSQILSYHLVSYRFLLSHIVLYILVLLRIISYPLISYCLVSSCIISYCLVSSCIVLHKCHFGWKPAPLARGVIPCSGRALYGWIQEACC